MDKSIRILSLAVALLSIVSLSMTVIILRIDSKTNAILYSEVDKLVKNINLCEKGK
jgi:hypothetical protein